MDLITVAQKAQKQYEKALEDLAVRENELADIEFNLEQRKEDLNDRENTLIERETIVAQNLEKIKTENEMVEALKEIEGLKTALNKREVELDTKTARLALIERTLKEKEEAVLQRERTQTLREEEYKTTLKDEMLNELKLKLS